MDKQWWNPSSLYYIWETEYYSENKDIYVEAY